MAEFLSIPSANKGDTFTGDFPLRGNPNARDFYTGFSWLVSGARKGGKCRCAMKTVYSVSRLRHIALLTAAGTDGGNCWVRRFVWHHGYGSQPPLLSLGGVVRVTATRSAPPRNLSHQNTYITRNYGPRGLWLRHTPPPPPASTLMLSSVCRRYSLSSSV